MLRYLSELHKNILIWILYAPTVRAKFSLCRLQSVGIYAVTMLNVFDRILWCKINFCCSPIECKYPRNSMLKGAHTQYIYNAENIQRIAYSNNTNQQRREFLICDLSPQRAARRKINKCSLAAWTHQSLIFHSSKSCIIFYSGGKSQHNPKTCAPYSTRAPIKLLRFLSLLAMQNFASNFNIPLCSGFFYMSASVII